MCAVVHELSIPLHELTRVLIACPKCAASVTAEVKDCANVAACPVCHYEFRPPLLQALRELAAALAFLVKSEALVSFRIAPPKSE